MSSHRFIHALVRSPSPKYAAYYAPRGIAISDERIRTQHKAYIAALRSAGLEASLLPPHPEHHDCIFIEDTAIVWQGHALITRMNDVRQGEQLEVETWLKSHGIQVHHPPPHARIEGGDVLHLDEITLVGQSARTNDAGIEALRSFMQPFGHAVQAVPVTRCLHLKTGITYLGDKTVLIAPKWIDVDLPQVYNRIEVPPLEPQASNALRVNDLLLVARGAAQTRVLLDRFVSQHNIRLIELDISEAQKGDGALTCQSILW